MCPREGEVSESIDQTPLGEGRLGFVLCARGTGFRWQYLKKQAPSRMRTRAFSRALREAAQDKNGATPLHRAVRTRCAAAVACLLEAGGDATIQNKPGSTPFHLAVQNTGRGGSGAEQSKTAQREIIQAFLARGVSTALKDRNGKTVLQWARSDSIREMFSGKID